MLVSCVAGHESTQFRFHRAIGTNKNFSYGGWVKGREENIAGTSFEILKQTNASPLLLEGIFHPLTIQRLENIIFHHPKEGRERFIAIGHPAGTQRLRQFSKPNMCGVKSDDETAATVGVLLPHPSGISRHREA